MGSRQDAISTFHATTKLPEAEWVLVLPAWEVWVHNNIYVDHLTSGYQLLLHRISWWDALWLLPDISISFDSHVYSYKLLVALKSKSVSSMWMAPECMCQLAVRAWNTYHESVTIQSIDSSTIAVFRSLLLRTA